MRRRGGRNAARRRTKSRLTHDPCRGTILALPDSAHPLIGTRAELGSPLGAEHEGVL